MIRRYEYHDVAYYVVRRADGRPLAVPDWMTRPEAANVKIVSTARLPVSVLLELRRVTVTGPSSCVHNGHEEEHDAAAQDKTPTPTFRRTSPRSRSSTTCGCAGAAPPDAGAVDAVADQDNPQGGRR